MENTKSENAVKLVITYLAKNEIGYERALKDVVINATLEEIAKKLGLDNPNLVESISINIEKISMVDLNG